MSNYVAFLRSVREVAISEYDEVRDSEPLPRQDAWREAICPSAWRPPVTKPTADQMAEMSDRWSHSLHEVAMWDYAYVGGKWVWRRQP